MKGEIFRPRLAAGLPWGGSWAGRAVMNGSKANMSRRNKGGKNRRETLLKSLEPSESGGFTTHSTKNVAKALGGRPAACTITGHCRTFVFKFPGAYLVAEEPIDHQVIYLHDGLKAAIVSDLPAYFEREPAESLHYSIGVALRAGVRSIYEKAVEQSNRQSPPEVPLFVVIEEYAEVPPTVLNSGECYMIDECHIKGGREGEMALVAERTIDGSWPDFHADMSVVNVVLASVKIEQNVTSHIEELYNRSCFVSSEGQAVYIRSTTMSASGETISYLEPQDLGEKADRIRDLLQGMMADSEPVAAELFDSILLDKTKDDGYLRLWYLRLWQALEDAKRHLRYPQLMNIRKVIAGKRTPKELKEYRKDIAHWYTGKIDYAYLSDLQRTALELLRRKYRPPKDNKSD